MQRKFAIRIVFCLAFFLGVPNEVQTFAQSKSQTDRPVQFLNDNKIQGELFHSSDGRYDLVELFDGKIQFRVP